MYNSMNASANSHLNIRRMLFPKDFPYIIIE